MHARLIVPYMDDGAATREDRSTSRCYNEDQLTSPKENGKRLRAPQSHTFASKKLCIHKKRQDHMIGNNTDDTGAI